MIGGGAWIEAAASLLLVVGLILGAGRLARLRGGGRAAANAHLAPVASLTIDARRRLHLVECDGRRVLLLTGGGDAMLLLDPPA